ncbi:MAG: MMPL family transporter [Bacilli bacterium]|nr:MMPL family transporter [Bacilli bacterium]
MKKITDLIVRFRNIILVLFIILAGISLYISKDVTINRDIAKYLPKTSETRQGMDIMEKEFGESNTSTLNIMFEDLSNDEKSKILDELTNIKGVNEVKHDESKDYNIDNYTLYVLTVDGNSESSTAKRVFDTVTTKYEDKTFATSGDVSEKNKSVLKIWVVVIAIIFAMIILIFMCDSYVEPFLFLFVIGLAVFINKGTNIMFDSVSHITDSIVAILQMALSMDYSIMLMNRYTQEKKDKKNKNKVEAMKEALFKSFLSISSSSVTTIVGLLALVFMSFTIGRDLGYVLAKGVLLSLICIFMCLPGLILLFDNLIEKTKKKVFEPKLVWLGNFEYRIRHIAPFLVIFLFVGSFFLKGNLGILYTGNENDEVAQVFKENNQMAIIYNNKYESDMLNLCNNINGKDIEVLCYGNTLNEKLKYDEFNEKLSSLGVDTKIDDYLLKILYYNYYNKNNTNKMTFNEFINFIEKDVYSNEKLNDKISNESKQNISKLKNFTNKDLYNKKLNSSEISNILGIDQDKVDALLIYYNSKNINNKLTITEFVDFMNNVVLKDSIYSASVDSNARASLKKLAKFINKNTINTALNSTDMASLFGIDKDTMDLLYTYYLINNNVETTLTINEFATFVLNNYETNTTLSSRLTTDNINNLKLLQTFSNKELINKKMNSLELSNMLGINENDIKQLLFLYYSNVLDDTKLSITDFIKSIYVIKNNTFYLEGTDVSSITNLYMFASNENDINTMILNKDGLNSVFSSINPNLVSTVYAYANKDDNYTTSIQYFLNLTIELLSNNLDSNTLNNLKLIKMIVDESISGNKTYYKANELANLLNQNQTNIIKLYGLINLANNNTSSWTLSINELVNLIIQNKDNPLVSSKLDNATISKLDLINNVMLATNNDVKFNYVDLANVIGMNETSIKSVYSLYEQLNGGIKITPIELTNFLLTHKSDEVLASKLNKNTLSDITLVNKIMNAVNNDTKFSAANLASLLGMKKDDISLIYSLYNAKYSKNNTTVSLKDFIDFVVKDVMNNKKYASNFDDSNKTKLTTINGIIKSSESKEKYTTDEIFAILSTLNNSLDKNMVELLNIYYGSEKSFNDSWTLTVEELIKYANTDIINDSRFKNFINDEMKKKITDANQKIVDAKKLLVGENYSRIVINTKLDAESDKTTEFIKNIKKQIKHDDIYLIGNSPMAYDLSNTFGKELDFITILTMVAIFVVVAITFKSIIIPGVLVVIIQTAVYLTMGVLSLLGGKVYFIALLIVQSILMGATIDYAIVYTSYYKELRQTLGVKDALINAYQKSIHTILTSASILIIVTLIVGNFASAIAAKICKTLSQGTISSLVLILFVLPAVLAAFDKVIIRKKKDIK